MRDVECVLLSTRLKEDSIGVQKEEIVKNPIPIIKVEDVYADEFYRANEQKYKLSVRLRISSLNYNGQQKLIYMNKKYDIIRTQEATADEIILICGKKNKNVK